jgi:hypothetical protein
VTYRAWAAFRRRSREEQRLLVEAAAGLCCARVSLVVFSPAAIAHWIAGRDARRRRPGAGHLPQDARRSDVRADVDAVAQAVTAVSRHTPFETTCLVAALTARAMLQRRGYDARVQLGVKQPAADERLQAHAWVECEGRTVVGDIDALVDYAVLGR